MTEMTHGEDESLEEQARAMLDRAGVPDASDYTAGELVEIANMLGELSSLRTENDRLRPDATRLEWLANHGGCPFAETDPAWDTPERFRKELDEAIAHEKK